MVPSAVFCGAIGLVTVLWRASSASISRRSSVNGIVAVRLFVRVKVAVSWGFGVGLGLFFSKSLGIVAGVPELVVDDVDSLPVQKALYSAGKTKSARSSGYCRTLLRVMRRMSWPRGASRRRSLMINK